MKLLRCVVEDNKDPEHLARVRIRVQGVHDPKLKNVKTEELPWSESLNPLDAGNTLGSSTNIIVGTWGYCFSLNDSYTEFLFIGTTKGIFNEVPKTDTDGDEIGFRSQDEDYPFPVRMGQADNPLTYGQKLDPDITQPRVEVAEFKEEIDTADKATYPNNKVYEDHNGNIVEIDGTKENSRIRIQHSTGARVEISVDGDITIQASKNGNIWMDTPGLFAIGADGNLIIDNDVKITGSLEVGVDITAKDDITSSAGEVADKEGNMTSLRLAHDTHGHIGNLGGPTTKPITPDPRTRTQDYSWIGTPK